MFQKTKEKLFTQSSINAILLTAVMMTLMHPFVIFGFKFPDLGFLAWVHLVPIVIALYRHHFGQRFFLFFLGASLGLFGLLYWLLIAMQQFGGIPAWQSVGILLILIAMLAVVMALPLALACWINGLNKLPFFILLPTFMMLRDVFMNYLPFGGFPWMLPAYSQGQWIQFFQWVDVTGVMGLSFYIYLVNGLIADGLILFLYGRQLDKLVSRLLVVFVLSLLSLYLSFLSGRHFEKTMQSKGTINVALVQGNVSQDLKWDPYQAQANLHKYLHLSSRAVKDGAELLLWPETAYPYGLREETLHKESFLDQEEMAVPLFFGAVAYDTAPAPRRQFNGVFQVDTHAKIVNEYYKMHLVPFGEYLPFEDYLGKLTVINEVGRFTPGPEPKLFEVKNIKFGSLICFEDVFSDVALQFSRLGADVLVNYTNDAWYKDSSAQYQHLVFSQFRALENRRPLLRVTNTGYTAVISARGEIMDEIRPFKEKVLLHELKVDIGDSLYTRYGEKWLLVLLSFTGLIFIYTVIKWYFGPVRKMG